MKPFITLDEKVLSLLPLETFMESCVSQGLKGFEIATHESLLDSKTYHELIRAIYKNNLAANFHVPDFVSPGEFEILRISEDRQLKENFTDLFIRIYNLHEEYLDQHKPMLTFHGAAVEHGDKHRSKDTTLLFVDWALNFLCKHQMPLSLAIETVNAAKTPSYGDSRSDTLQAVNIIGSEDFGICWDIVHDALNQSGNYKHPDQAFLARVINAHVHGYGSFNQSQCDHIPLSQSEIDISGQIELLKSIDYKGPICNELLFAMSSDYLKDLEKDNTLLIELLK